MKYCFLGQVCFTQPNPDKLEIRSTKLETLANEKYKTQARLLHSAGAGFKINRKP
jgi:hypothetical protein